MHSVLTLHPFLLVPSEVSSLIIVFFNSSSVTIQWRPPEFPNGVVTHYSLQLNENDIVNISSNVLMYTTGGLSPDTEYVLQLRAHTGAGAGPSNNRTFVTSKVLNIMYIVIIISCSVYSVLV